MGHAQIREGRILSPEEAMQRVETGSAGMISRRTALKLGAVTAAGLALAACAPSSKGSGGGASPGTSLAPKASGSAEEAKIVVVGAGLAGTTAAYRLANAGLNVSVYEARDRIGGRCWTGRGWPNDQYVERGGEFLDTRHVHIRQLAEELGLKEEDLWKGWEPGSAWLTYVDGKVGTWKDWADDQKPVAAAVEKTAEEIGLTTRTSSVDLAAIWAGSATPEAVALDQLSMEEYLQEHAPQVLGTPYHLFLDEVMASWYGLNMASLSAVNWMDYYVIPAKGADERYHIRGGNDQIPARAAEALPEGTMHLEAPLEAMRRSGNGYELTFANTGDPVYADFVVMTAPFTTLQDVDFGDSLSAVKQDEIDHLGMGTDIKMFMQYGVRPESFQTKDGQWSGGLEQADAQFETWESTEVQPGPTSILTVYAGGRGSTEFANPEYHAVPPEEMVQTTLGHIDAAVPGSKKEYDGEAWLDYWTGDPWTRGSYAAMIPGTYTKFWGATARPDGNVHFAGEHTSTYSQGYLNGGVESGQRAAIEVMEKLGVEPPGVIAVMPYSPIDGAPPLE